jgi:hypothetical protein
MSEKFEGWKPRMPGFEPSHVEPASGPASPAPAPDDAATVLLADAPAAPAAPAVPALVAPLLRNTLVTHPTTHASTTAHDHQARALIVDAADDSTISS